MSGDLHIRPAEIGDIDAVRDLSQQLARHIEAPAPQLTAEQFAARYVGPGAPMRLMLAVADGRVAGLVAWTLTCELYSGDLRLYISDLVIDRDMRGRGLGGALMAEVTAWALAHGVAKLGWDVWHRNDTAKAFYEGLGARHDRDALPYLIELPA